MDLTNDFEVNVPIDTAWKILTDIERIAPCMPGAQLQEVEGDEYRGVVKVKVGPITAQYKGKATFAEKDDDAHVAVLKADGRDTRGQGNANALITARLTEAGESTQVSVHTDLTVTGKVAQFGRGVMADVSAKLLDQFVENLETMVLADSSDGDSGAESGQTEHTAEAEDEETTPAAVTSPQASASSGSAAEPATAAATAPADEASSSTAGVRRIDQRPAEPVDLLGTAGAPVAKRAVPAVLAVVALFIIWRWLRGRDD